MIKLHELSESTRCLLDVLSASEVQGVLDMATDMMMTMEQRNCRARLGENGSVELAIKMILFVSERGTEHE